MMQQQQQQAVEERRIREEERIKTLYSTNPFEMLIRKNKKHYRLFYIVSSEASD